ncbi:DUF7559 family protein [Halorubrum sp. FL23]
MEYTQRAHNPRGIHYTYDVPDDHAVDDLSCPYCGGSDLAEIEV